jgi:hypothetical protein
MLTRLAWQAGPLLLLLPLLAAPFVLTNDGFEHAYSAFAWWYAPQADPGLGVSVEPHTPLTNHGFWPFYLAAHALVGWPAAWLLAVSAMVAALAAATGSMLRLRDDALWRLGLLPALTLGWSLHMGFFNYCIGMGATWLLWRWWAPRAAAPDRATALAATLAVLVISLVHSFAALVAWGGLAVLTALPLMRHPARWLPALGPLALTALPVAASVVLMSVLRFERVDDDEVRWQWWVDPERWSAVLQTGTTGPLWLVLPVLLLAAAGIVGRLRQGLDDTDSATAGLALGAALSLIAWLGLPFEVPGWQGLSPRFALPALVVGVALFPTPTGRARPFWTTAWLLFGVVTLQWHADAFRARATACADWVDALQHPLPGLPRGQGQMFALQGCGTGGGFLDHPDIPILSSVSHASAGLAIAHGLLYPGFHGSEGIHFYSIHTQSRRLAMRRSPPRAFAVLRMMQERGADVDAEPGLRQELTTAVLEQLSVMDTPLVWGSDEALAPFYAAGFGDIGRRGDLRALTFEGCTHRIEVDTTWTGPLAVAWGWVPLPTAWGPYDAVWMQPTTAAGQQVRTLDLEAAPCGPIWVMLHPGEDLTVPPLRCAEAPVPVLVSESPATPLRCTVVPDAEPTP